MTYGRRNPAKGERKATIALIRDRDGDRCVHCDQPLDFSITDSEHPGFITLEHWPVPWRICRSHDPRHIKLAHRFCNEEDDLKARVQTQEASPKVLERYRKGWAKRLGRCPKEIISGTNTDSSDNHQGV